MPLPSRRGIYFLEARPENEGGLYIWVRHRGPGDARKRKVGRSLEPYFKRRGWSLGRHLNDARCMQIVEELRREIDGAAATPEGERGPPLLGLVDEYAAWLTGHGRSAQHVHRTRRRLRAVLGRSARQRETPPLAWSTAQDLGRRELDAYLVARRNAGRGANDCNHDLRAWHAFAAWIVERGDLAANPLAGLHHFKQPETPPKVLSPTDLEELLKQCRRKPRIETDEKTGLKYPVAGAPPWLEPAVMLLAHTGMRPVELARLTWDHVDLAAKRLTVLRKGGEQWAVPIAKPLARYLARTSKQRRSGKVVPGFPYNELRTTPGTYFGAVRTAAEDAGLEGVTLYWLRHSVAQHLADTGESESRLQAMMGWKSGQMARRYIKLSKIRLAGMADKLPWCTPAAGNGNKRASRG